MPGLLQTTWDHIQANHEPIKEATVNGANLALLTGIAAFIADQYGIPIEATALISGISTGILAVALNQCRTENRRPNRSLFCSSALISASGALLMDTVLHATYNAAETLAPFTAAALGGAVIGAALGACAGLPDSRSPIIQRFHLDRVVALCAGAAGGALHTASIAYLLTLDKNLDVDAIDRSYLFQLPIGLTAATISGALLGTASGALPYAREGVQIHQEREVLEREALMALTLLTGKMLNKNLGDIGTLPDAALANIASFLYPKDPNSNVQRIVARIKALPPEQRSTVIMSPVSNHFSNEQKDDIEMGLRSPNSNVSNVTRCLTRISSPLQSQYSTVRGG